MRLEDSSHCSSRHSGCMASFASALPGLQLYCSREVSLDMLKSDRIVSLVCAGRPVRGVAALSLCGRRSQQSTREAPVRVVPHQQFGSLLGAHHPQALAALRAALNSRPGACLPDSRRASESPLRLAHAVANPSGLCSKTCCTPHCSSIDRIAQSIALATETCAS